MPPKKIEKLSATLDKILAARGLGSRLKEYRIFSRWEKTVGKTIASHAWPVSFRGKKLSVAVDSSAWMQQLTLLKPELIEKLNAHLGKDAVRSITFKLSEVGAREPRGETPSSGTLTAEERKKVEGYLQALSDPEVKEILRHVIEQDLLRKKKGRVT